MMSIWKACPAAQLNVQVCIGRLLYAAGCIARLPATCWLSAIIPIDCGAIMLPLICDGTLSDVGWFSCEPPPEEAWTCSVYAPAVVLALYTVMPSLYVPVA